MEQSGLQVESFLVIDGQTQEVPLTSALDARPAFIIGGDPRSQLRLDDANVAPAHAVINRKDDAYFIAPRFPNQYVYLNGKRVTTPARLTPGDVVQVGATRLRFDQAERPVTTPPPARKPDAVLPVSAPPARSAPAYAIATAAPRLVASAMPTQEIEVHYPRAAQAGASNTSVVSMLLGVVTILAIVGVLGYNFLSVNTASTASAAIPVDFAYQDGNVTIVMFDADWCVYCKQQEPILSSVARAYRGDAYVEHVNIDRRSNRALVDKYGVSATPTLVILNDQGEISSQFRGLTQESVLRQAVQQALAESTGTATVR